MNNNANTQNDYMDIAFQIIKNKKNTIMYNTQSVTNKKASNYFIDTKDTVVSVIALLDSEHKQATKYMLCITNKKDKTVYRCSGQQAKTIYTEMKNLYENRLKSTRQKNPYIDRAFTHSKTFIR